MDIIGNTDTIPRNKPFAINMLKWTVNKTANNNNNKENMSIFIDQEPVAPKARRSLGTALQSNAQRPKSNARKSLGNAVVSRKMLRNQNKENHIMVSPHAPNMMRNSPTTSTPNHTKTENAFRDLGNMTPQQSPALATTPLLRKTFLPPSPSPTTSLDRPSAVHQPLDARSRLFAATLPTLEVEYSPVCNVDCAIEQRSPLAVHGITVQQSIFGNPRYFASGPSMPKKPRTDVTPPEMTPLGLQLAKLRFSQTSLRCPADDTLLNMSSKSLDDTALERMIDDILESKRKVRKMPACPVTTSSTAQSASSSSESETETVAEQTIIVRGDREREVRTPDSTCTAIDAGEEEEEAVDQCNLRRQRVVRRKHTTAKGKGKLTGEQTAISSTITPPAVHHCEPMTISIPQQSTPESDAESAEQQHIRRCLRYPDSPDSMEDSLEKRQSVASSTESTSSGSSSGSMRCAKAALMQVFGTLDVSVAVQAHQVHVHVLRCKDLYRSNGGPINAYVKVNVLSQAQTGDAGFQRTAVQRNSSEPIFEHRFVFDQIDAQATDRVQLSVWHRDRQYKRSEFLGCTSFPIKQLSAQSVAGTYRLQSQANLSHPTAAVLVEAQQPTNNNGSASISLSKKAVHQREADEHLFLRYLSLDNNVSANASGRTACTLSKRMTSGESSGFGFTVVWTHPPRVEKVEPGLPADRAGLQSGDFLAFVGEHNVVTMPEVDVLNLIRSQGQQLNIEVFRKPAAAPKRRSSTFETAAGLVDEPQRMKIARVEFCQDVGSGIIV